MNFLTCMQQECKNANKAQTFVCVMLHSSASCVKCWKKRLHELFDMHAAGMQGLLTKLFYLCYVAQLGKLCEVLEKHCHFVDFNELF